MLCGRPIGCIKRLVLSIRLSVRLSLENKERGKIKIGIELPHGTSKPIFRCKGRRSRLLDVRTPQNSLCLLTGRQSRRLQTRPTPLLGLIYCGHLNNCNGRISRHLHSAATCFLVYIYFSFASNFRLLHSVIFCSRRMEAGALDTSSSDRSRIVVVS